jgi:hypothetical protein
VARLAFCACREDLIHGMSRVRTMFRIGESALVHSAPGEVFAFVSDLRNFPLWRANLATSRVVSDGFTDVGARCEEEIQIGPRTIPATCQITRFDAGRTFSFRALSPGLQYDGLVDVEEGGDDSRFTLTGDITVTGLLRLLQPALRRRLQDGVRKEVAAIKAHVEQEA